VNLKKPKETTKSLHIEPNESTPNRTIIPALLWTCTYSIRYYSKKSNLVGLQDHDDYTEFTPGA